MTFLRNIAHYGRDEDKFGGHASDNACNVDRMKAILER
jgi:hypothetical protein